MALKTPSLLRSSSSSSTPTQTAALVRANTGKQPRVANTTKEQEGGQERVRICTAPRQNATTVACTIPLLREVLLLLLSLLSANMAAPL
eukprot:CAMPEP_0175100806 /NCGR_PEP_ID=MMETSP0086_2-20121207/7355_1 /TAXON_ID=136419 /ORGANISM="Unknown Unknown, Strain D1" /LENGTH=88 /DNA_ID=CAMNT_0016375085 /DNA_START=96 /DNA_END=362 /DNA_ORIENTATION=-